MVSIWCFSPGSAPLRKTNSTPERAETSSKVMEAGGAANAASAASTAQIRRRRTQEYFMTGLKAMRYLFALLLAAAAGFAAQPAPRLAISIEQAITRPGRNGNGPLIRPLVLILSNWEEKTPKIEAY